MKSQRDRIRVVLFDVGGVLVELSGVPTMLQWMSGRVSADELWRMWLTSPAVRAFETGQISPEAFAYDLIAEMALPVGRDKLLAEFTRWVLGAFPGALELVRRIPRQYTRATLSNTNELHWPLLMTKMGLENAFDHHFPSYQTGKIKPDPEVFHHVTHALNCDAEEIFFLDDNLINVEAAQKLGINAVQVRGISAAEEALSEAGILSRSSLISGKA